MPEVVHLDQASVDAIARRVVELLAGHGAAPAAAGWLTAVQVAERLGVSRDYVYDHAGQLGGQRIGDGPRPRLRFDAAAVATWQAAQVSCGEGRRPPAGEPPAQAPHRRRRRRARSGTDVDLLPVRGVA